MLSLHFKYVLIISSTQIQLFPNLSWLFLIMLEHNGGVKVNPFNYPASHSQYTFSRLCSIYHKIDFQ